jgi:hypothetical protein
MGIWIELGIFAVVIVFALWQLHDVKQEKLKRERAREQQNKLEEQHKLDQPPKLEQQAKPDQERTLEQS